MSKKILSDSLCAVALRAIFARGLAFLFVAVVLLAGTVPTEGRAADPTPTELYGIWRLEEPSGLICNLEFRKDGAFVSDVSRKGKAIGEFAGQWTLKADIVSYTYTKSNVKQIPVGSKDQDHIVELTPDHIDLQSDKGAVKRYMRVPAK